MNEFFSFVAENRSAIGTALLEHIAIVATALLVAIPIGVATGIGLSRMRSAVVREGIFNLLGIGQTVPSLAILALAVALIGVGVVPAIITLALYVLLPIARNTTAGMESIADEVRDVGRGMGMTPVQMLRRVELPLAAPLIVAGIRTATVVAMSAGALASLIGAGGLGYFIFSGIATYRPEVMLVGAIPTALLALVADGALGALERKVVPRAH